MKTHEVQALLAVAGAFDNRKPDLTGVTATIWHRVLADIDYADAEAAVIAHQTGPRAGEYLTVKHITDAVAAGNRTTRKLIEADVRAARARQIVDAGWPENEPLTPAAADALAAARLNDLRTAERFELDAAGPGTAPDFGVIMKNIP